MLQVLFSYSEARQNLRAFEQFVHECQLYCLGFYFSVKDGTIMQVLQKSKIIPFVWQEYFHNLEFSKQFRVENVAFCKVLT